VSAAGVTAESPVVDPSVSIVSSYQLLVIRFLYSAAPLYFSRPIQPDSGVPSVAS
jgi:hypothetical protein